MYYVDIYDKNGVLRFWVGGRTHGKAIDRARCKVAEHCLAHPEEPPAGEWHLGNPTRQ